jgi:predicted glycoside hydrolase/deacetylase ChbG (UPF0249 family)
LKKLLLFFLLLVINILPGLTQTRKKEKAKPIEPPQLLIRCDDVGMCHSVNVATEQLIKTGLPVSTSVMFACPWYQEAVEMLRQYPEVAVGIHLTLGSEWKNYRWGPISGAKEVPTLVDKNGLFWPTPGDLLKNNPSITEIEEFRAQIDRALRSGLKITYLDNHMGAGLYTPEQMDLLEKLAKEYKLGISSFLGEAEVPGTGSYPFTAQPDSMMAIMKRLPSGAPNFMIMHLGLVGPEMDALTDSNEGGTKEMSRQRQLELEMLSSPAFRQVAQAKNIKLITYRDLVNEASLKKMHRPVRKK